MSWKDTIQKTNGIPPIMLRDLMRYTEDLAEFIMESYSDDESENAQSATYFAKKVLDEIELLKRSGVR